jgi:hypothetical protein
MSVRLWEDDGIFVSAISGSRVFSVWKESSVFGYVVEFIKEEYWIILILKDSW